MRHASSSAVYLRTTSPGVPSSVSTTRTSFAVGGRFPQRSSSMSEMSVRSSSATSARCLAGSRRVMAYK